MFGDDENGRLMERMLRNARVGAGQLTCKLAPLLRRSSPGENEMITEKNSFYPIFPRPTSNYPDTPTLFQQ